MIRDTLDLLQYKIGLKFTDADTRVEIAGLIVQIDGEEKTTSAEGTVIFPGLSTNENDLVIQTPCYNYLADLDFNSDTSFDIALHRTRYLLDIEAVDKETGLPLSDIVFLINDSIFTGQPQLWPCGPLNYQLLKNDLLLYTGEGWLISDTTIRIELYAGALPVDFYVFDATDSSAINEASISLGITKDITDINGHVTIFIQPGTYPLSIVAPDYFEYMDTVSITNAGITLNVALQLHYADIKFILYEEGIPVNNAEINLPGRSEITNALGITYFRQLEVGKWYPFTIQKQNYLSVEDSVYLRRDTTMNIEMKLTGVDPLSSAILQIYPNPANSYLVVVSNESIAHVMFTDLSGRTFFLKENLNDVRYTLELDHLPEGSYILQVKLVNHDEVLLRKIHILK